MVKESTSKEGERGDVNVCKVADLDDDKENIDAGDVMKQKGESGRRYRSSAQHNVRAERSKWDVIETGVKGFVRWYNVHRRFGFIARENGDGEDLFVHQSAIVKSRIRKPYFRILCNGEPVVFDVVVGLKGPEADNVTGPGGTEVFGGFYHFLQLVSYDPVFSRYRSLKYIRQESGFHDDRPPKALNPRKVPIEEAEWKPRGRLYGRRGKKPESDATPDEEATVEKPSKRHGERRGRPRIHRKRFPKQMGKPLDEEGLDDTKKPEAREADGSGGAANRRHREALRKSYSKPDNGVMLDGHQKDGLGKLDRKPVLEHDDLAAGKGFPGRRRTRDKLRRAERALKKAPGKASRDGGGDGKHRPPVAGRRRVKCSSDEDEEADVEGVIAGGKGADA